MFYVFADDSQLHAQVPASFSSGASKRHSQTALQCFPYLRVQGDPVHCCNSIPERKGELKNRKAVSAFKIYLISFYL